MSAWLWLLLAALLVLPVILRFCAEDNHPRNDDPPDSGEDPGPAALRATA